MYLYLYLYLYQSYKGTDSRVFESSCIVRACFADDAVVGVILALEHSASIFLDVISSSPVLFIRQLESKVVYAREPPVVSDGRSHETCQSSI